MIYIYIYTYTCIYSKCSVCLYVLYVYVCVDSVYVDCTNDLQKNETSIPAYNFSVKTIGVILRLKLISVRELWAIFSWRCIAKYITQSIMKTYLLDCNKNFRPNWNPNLESVDSCWRFSLITFTFNFQF